MNLLLHSISKLFILRKTIVSGIAHITSTFSTRIGELCHDLKLLSKIQIKQRVGVEKNRLYYQYRPQSDQDYSLGVRDDQVYYKPCDKPKMQSSMLGSFPFCCGCW